MTLDLRMTPKITGLFVVFAALLLAGVGGLAYLSGREALRRATVGELQATVVEKQGALDRWLEERQADLATLAASSHVRDTMATLSRVAPTSARARAARGRLVADFQP